MLLLIFLFLFAAIVLSSLYVWRPRENTVARRLGMTPVYDARVRQLEASAGRRVALPFIRRSGQILSGVLPRNLVQRTDHMLIEADQPWTLAGFLTGWALCGGVCSGLWLYVVFSSQSITPFQAMAMGCTIVPFGVGMPYALLRKKVKSRQKAIMLALPNALDLLVTCVEAGVGVDSAFALVTEKMDGPISETFALYLRQVGLGRPRKDALTYVADRSGLPDLIGLAAAVSQSEDLGTTMGDVLRLQAEDLRAARRERAQTAAQRAPVLMTIPLTLCFLPAMGAVVVVPSILNFIQFFGTMSK